VNLIVLDCVGVCWSVLHCAAVRCSALQCVAVRCSALQCVAVRCSALQRATACCSLLQYVAVRSTHLEQKLKREGRRAKNEVNDETRRTSTCLYSINCYYCVVLYHGSEIRRTTCLYSPCPTIPSLLFYSLSHTLSDP